MRTYCTTITPEIAGVWLQENKTNRPVKEYWVRHLASVMGSGRWKLNGETIKRAEGRLIDGQHRLLACIKSDCSFETFVVEGVDSGAFDTIDVGIPRSSADTLSVRGEINCKRLGAALLLLKPIETGTLTDRPRKMSNVEIGDLLAENPGIRESVNRADVVTSLAHPSLLAALHYLFSKRDKQRADSFIGRLADGEDLHASRPVFVLRERLIRNATSSAKLSIGHIAALIIKAWNLERLGKPARQISFQGNRDNPERFPVIE